jgi:aspartate carbamoyltransferase catalytic subunit
MLAALADRGGRELPVAADFVGAHAALPPGQSLALNAPTTANSRSRSKTTMHNPQLNKNGELQHLLTIEGLPKSIVNHILDTASSFVGISDREVKKVPLMRGKSVFNLFFENSTRTRTTFEIASKRLSADVINLNIAGLLDQQGRVAAGHHRQPGGHARRHVRGAPRAVGRALPDRQAPERHEAEPRPRGQRRRRPPRAPDPGPARHVHHPPLQEGLHQPAVAIVGDILHSRVARSDIHALTTLGVPEVRAIGPHTCCRAAWSRWACACSPTWKKA